ncbi:hypothetical protein N8613_01700 [Verrucomicrobia bacterium]|jgi:hypothetical protein|nr:hypothetical protein [Verrucomicrobiota bacterium]
MNVISNLSTPNIYKSKSIAAVAEDFKKAQDRNALIKNSEYSDRTAAVLADNSDGATTKTHLVVSCDDSNGYLGSLVINPKLYSQQYSTATLYHLNWKVTRYQFNWYEIRGEKSIHQYTRIREAPKHNYWRILRIRWEPGLPAKEDYDVQCDSWIEEDLKTHLQL